MSDDTPTQRFPSSEGGDTPTQWLETGEIQEDLQEEKQKSKGLMTGLIAAGALLLIAIIVLVIVLLTRGDDPVVAGTDSPLPSDSASPTSTASATPTPTPEPEQPEEPEEPQPEQPVGPVITDFSTGTSTVTCDDDIDLYITWSTTGGNRVYFGIDTDDASTAPFFDNLPLSGNSGSNFPSGYSPFQFSCGSETHKYTLTVVDGNGNKASKSVTVTDLSGNF